ncbi:MAG TPA: phosphatase PAP2 family protein [Gemmatimonadales bacterium]|nr:phosphatase PAP2 family protein [Gemmatimonadales bacterium]
MNRALPLLLGLLVGVPNLAPAQSVDTFPELPAGPQPPSEHLLRWYHGAAAAGGVSLLMLLDHPVQRYAMHNNGTGANNVARTVRHFGQPEVYATVTAGLVATGLITGNQAITRSGGRLALSLALAGAATEAGKIALGRPRPEQSLDADGYSPFSGQASFPSGHSAIAFALATSLADDIHRPWATVGLYGMATAVGWSRINDNRHWLSDVGAGAILGITSAKLASGRWRIFGLKPPSFITGPRGMGLGWQGSF